MTPPHTPGGMWRWEPNPTYVSDLDDIFAKGNAPRLAGMLLSLVNESNSTGNATPCYLNSPALAPLAPNDGEYTSHVAAGSGSAGAEAYSLLQGSARSDPQPDLTVEQFFYHADILSGQDVGKVREHLGTKLDRLDLTDGGFVERAVIALDATRTGDATSYWTSLTETFSSGKPLWDHWKGETAREAEGKFFNVLCWFNNHGGLGEFRQLALLNLSNILIKYAATIHGARMSLDNLMGELVDQVIAWNDGPNPDAKPGKGVSLSEIKGLVIESNPLAHVFNVVEAVWSVVGAALEDEKTLGNPQIYDKLTEFLKVAEGIIQETVSKVNALIRELDRVRDGRDAAFVGIPVWAE